MVSRSVDSRPGRLISIQVCRGLAAILVLLSHLGELEHKYFKSQIMAVFHSGVIGVDLFFVISGIVITSVTVDKFGSVRNAATFLGHRFTRIYPPYWVYSTLILIAFLINPLWVNSSGGHHVDIVRSFLLVPGQYPMLVMQGWTLSFEIYFYLVFSLMLLLPERLAWTGIVAWTGAVSAYALWSGANENSPLMSLLAGPMILEFAAGCAVYKLYSRFSLPRKAGFVLIAGSFAWLVLANTQIPRLHSESPFYRPILFGPFAAMLLWGMLELERQGHIRYPRFLARIGDWSYSIYLSHIIVAEMVGRAMFKVAPNLPATILVVTAITIPSALLVGYLSFTLIERRFLLSRTQRPNDSEIEQAPRILQKSAATR